MSTRELVPRFLLERLAAGAPSGELPASALYLDVAGFTPMTEALARHGAHGAEVLAELLQATWIPIVNAVHAHGGFQAAFAGDSLTGAFIGPEHRQRACAAAEAIAAALAPMRLRTTSYGSFEVSARLGVGSGELRWEILRAGEARSATYMFSGSAIAHAVAAEATAPHGAVRADARLASALGSHPPPAPPADLDVEALAKEFVPDELLHWQGPGEFRAVVLLFIAIAPARVPAVTAAALELRERFGGLLRPVESGDKGCVLLSTWGAPVGYEGDPGRALRFALALCARCPDVRVGAGYGTAFAGFVGPPEREEYAIYGAEVNLAARLMGQAGAGEIVVSPALAARLGDTVTLRSLGARRLKGIPAPVELRLVLDTVAGGARVPRTWVDRDEELGRFAEVLAALGTGVAAGTVVVRGEAGIGKSSLVGEARRRWGGRWLSTAADPVWRAALAPLRELVTQTLGEDSLAELGLAEHRDFLAALVAPESPGPAWERTPPAERQRRTLDAVVALLRARAGDGLVVQIDDIHWLDLETRAFLPALAGALADLPFALVLTTRPGEDLELPDPVLELPLSPLPPDMLGALAASRVGRPLAPVSVTWLAERTGGNPFFAEQVLLHLAERELLSDSPDGLRLDVAPSELPPTVEEVVIARLDGLPAATRRAVRTAAVLGLRPDIGELAHVLAGSGEELEEAIAVATAKGFWSHEGETLEFTHALVRDAAYATLLVATRRRLHAAAAAAIEAREDIGPHLHRLAGHLGAAGELARAADCERRAADRACGLGAYREAADYALAGLDYAEAAEDPAATARTRLGLWLALGTARIVTHGQTAPETRDAYNHAYALSGALETTREGFRTLFGLRTYALFAGEHETSLAMAERSLEVAREIGDGDLLVQAELMVGNARFWVGDLDGALAHLDEMEALLDAESHAAHLASFAQDPRFTALFPLALGLSLRGEGQAALARAYDALAEARAIEHRFSEAMVLQVIGFLHARSSQADAALAAGRELVALAQAEGFPVYAAIGGVITGWAQARLGEVAEGLALVDATTERMRSGGINVAGSLIGALVADAHLAGGEPTRCLDVAREALEAARERHELAFAGDLERLIAAARAELGELPAGHSEEKGSW